MHNENGYMVERSLQPILGRMVLNFRVTSDLSEVMGQDSLKVVLKPERIYLISSCFCLCVFRILGILPAKSFCWLKKWAS
jgi:hypothetical protein